MERIPAWLPAFGTVVRIGHRGAASELPGNTLASYRRAADLGCHMVEVDVHQTADGVLLLTHDDVLHGPQGGMVVEKTSTANLRLVDVAGGEPPPLLSEATDLLRGRCGLLIDLKGTGFEAALAEHIECSGVREIMVCGNNLDSLLKVGRLRPETPLSWTLDPTDPLVLSHGSIPDVPTPWVTVNYRKLTPEAITAFHDRSVRVIAWTVDQPGQVNTLLDCGVDGITSNDPAMVVRVLEARARRPGWRAGH